MPPGDGDHDAATERLTSHRACRRYFTEGSHNMDQRGLMSDGEATLIVSGPQAAAGLVDLFYMMARTTWIDRPAELEQLLPRRSRIVHKFARWARATL